MKMEEQLHAFSTSALDESVWWASHPGCFNPEATRKHWTESWVGPATVWTQRKRKNLYTLFQV